MHKHISEQYDLELSQIRDTLMEMAGLEKWLCKTVRHTHTALFLSKEEGSQVVI